MSMLAEHFGAVYLVNLPERLDRLKSAKKQLARAGWSLGPAQVQRFPAHSFADRAGFPNAGARGCFQSHLECLRRAQRDHRESVLILEDDITFCSALPRLSQSVLSQMESLNWDFVYFGHEGTGEIPRAERNTPEVHFDRWSTDLLTTHFYGVSARILSRLIAHLDHIANGVEGDQEAGPMPLDGAYNIFRRNNPDVRCLIAVPKLGWQRPSRSDIMPKAFDGLRVLHPLTTALRELKHLSHLWRS
jgi:glycosyl transferase, family 25